MKHLEEIADTLGIDLHVSRPSGMIGGHRNINVKVAPDLTLAARPRVLTAYHDADEGLAILAGTLAGDLGFLIYNSQIDGRECVELMFFDTTKLGFDVKDFFEANESEPVSALAARFDPSLICQVRRFAGEKTYALIDDRRANKDAPDAEILDGGGTPPREEGIGAKPDELPSEHSEA